MKEEDATLIGNAQIYSSGHFPLVIGVDLGGTQLRTAVLQGAILKSRVNLLTGEDPTPDRIMPRIFQAVEQALEAADTMLDEISGIGIAAPGPLDNRTGVVFAPPNLPGWDHVPLKDLFQQRFNVPIFVENDANTAALGEYMFGAGRDSKEMVYMTISTGIGGGIISGGKILEGVSGTAAELGHMTIDWRGERCNCGNIGCLEAITSGTAIGRRANEMIAIGKGEELLAFALTQQKPTEENKSGAPTSTIHVNARTVAMAAEAGIPLARDIIARAAEALGGGVTQMGAVLLDPARRIVEQRAMSVPREAVRIVLAELGINVGLVGAGALIY